ncbi:hypothetical protein TWF281_000331 [Arthrobotrys megalospora]
MHMRTRSRNRLSGALDSLRDRVGRSGDRLAANSQFLAYHDVSLYQEDINALENDWLTDTNIAFWQEYLEREVLSHSDCTGILLLRPTMVFLLRLDSILNVLSALPPIAGVTHIFLPINDNRDPNLPEGGSHWSLLVVSVNDRKAFHYDSLGGSNRRHAREVAAKVEEWMGYPLNFQDLDDDTPQQGNSYDCGVHVCLNMRYLLVKRLLDTPPGKGVNMSLKGKQWDARKGRDEMLKIVRGLRRTAERSLSPGERGRDGVSPTPRIS